MQGGRRALGAPHPGFAQISPALAYPKESCCAGSLGSTHTKHRTNPLPSYYHLRPRYKPVPAMSYKPVPVPAMSYKPVPAKSPKPPSLLQARPCNEPQARSSPRCSNSVRGHSCRPRQTPLPHSPPPLPFFSCLFPATATQQNKSCSEIHHLSWLGCLLRSFVCSQTFRARDLTALASFPCLVSASPTKGTACASFPLPALPAHWQPSHVI